MVVIMLSSMFIHYKNTHMQYTEILRFAKIKNYLVTKNFNIFNNFTQNIDCGYTLEPPQRGSSNEYPQSMFWIKNRYTPANPSFSICKSGVFEGIEVPYL